MKTRKRYILAKIESTYGVDPTPTAGANAILTSGLNRKIYEGNKVTRELDRATLGADEEINTGPYAMVEFGVELAGSGALGTAPAWGPLLRACGFAETITASTSVEYDPVSVDYESVTLWYDQDGERQIIKGARGTVRFALSAESIPMMFFSFTGLYAKPTTQSLLAPDISSFLFPLPVNNVNTPTCTFDAYDAILSNLDLDWGGEVPYFNLVNLEKVDITDRSPVGSATILAPLLGTKDMFALAESHNSVTLTDFQLVHGTATGNVITIDAPTTQLSGITEVDIKGELGYQMGMRMLPGASGDDEFKITVT